MKPLVTVGQIDANGRRLRTLKVPVDAVPTARAHGWWVFEDFEQQFMPERTAQSQADGHGDDDDD